MTNMAYKTASSQSFQRVYSAVRFNGWLRSGQLESTMCVPAFLVLLLLVSALPSRMFAQRSLSAHSRLNDVAYLEKSIKAISDSNVFSSIELPLAALASVQTAVRRGDSPAAYRAWSQYWECKPQPKYVSQSYRLLIDTDLLMTYDEARSYVESRPEEKESTLVRANLLLNNVLHAWGNTVIEFGPSVDFNKEIGQSGKYGFHYWIWSRPLNTAYLLTGDQKYLAKFDELFNRWYEQRNLITRPIPELDVVYYELGLGGRNRMFIEHYLMPFEKRTWQTHERMLKTVLGAARWLYELEKWEGYRSGNWQSHGSYMLAQIAMVFPEFKESTQWLDLALQRIEEHLNQDWFEDGGHSARAPRNYTLATYLTYRNLYVLLTSYGVRRDLADRIRSSMGKTIDWWITMMAPTGEVPAINDSHRGLFPSHILRDGALFFGIPEANAILKNLLGVNAQRPSALPTYTSRHMPASGFTVMRSDWTREARYMNINYGKWNGSHTHNDMLDFEIYAYGKALAVDAGIGMTYDDSLYVPWYKSSKAHNMVVVNDLNMDRERVEGERIRWGETGSLNYFAGEHRGYARLGVHHQRQIAFVKGTYWIIFDHIESSNDGDTLSWYFHSPTTLIRNGNGFRSAEAPGILVLPADGQVKTKIGKGMAASTDHLWPGKTQEIDWISFDQMTKAGSTRQFAVLLYPYREALPSVDCSLLAADHVRVVTNNVTHDLYFSANQSSGKDVRTDAAFLLLEKIDGTPVRFSLVEGTYFSYRGVEVWRSAAIQSVDRQFKH